MTMTLDEIRREITLALTPVQQSLESLHREQHDLAAEVWKQGVLLGRLDERIKLLWNGSAKQERSQTHQRWNGHAKPAASGAALVGVIWALVEIIQTLIAAP